MCGRVCDTACVWGGGGVIRHVQEGVCHVREGV